MSRETSVGKHAERPSGQIYFYIDARVRDGTRIYFRGNNCNMTYVGITKNIQAVKGIDVQYDDRRSKLLPGDKPFDVKTYMVTENTALKAALRNDSSTAAMDGFCVLDGVQYVNTGIIDPHEMISGMHNMLNNTVVQEH